MDKFLKFFGLACGVLIVVGVVAYGGYLYGTSHSGDGSTKVAENSTQRDTNSVPAAEQEPVVSQKLTDPRAVAFAKCLAEEFGMSEGNGYEVRNSGRTIRILWNEIEVTESQVNAACIKRRA